ncbi:aminoacyl-tRNA deacylase [Streptococcaceae bacterium ESL0687]|nr:aminoacyl-tRNA deacylase [Streptococcaceae bacterium ESL0687]
MSKKKLKKTLVEQILDQKKIPHEGIKMNILEGQNPLNLEEKDVYKTLALKNNKDQAIIGIVPINQHLSLKKLAQASSSKKVAMIPLKDLQKTTGYVHGANNPVGIWQTKKFPIFIDKLAETEDFIVVSAGEIGRSIKINPKDLASLVQAQFSDLIE